MTSIQPDSGSTSHATSNPPPLLNDNAAGTTNTADPPSLRPRADKRAPRERRNNRPQQRQNKNDQRHITTPSSSLSQQLAPATTATTTTTSSSSSTNTINPSSDDSDNEEDVCLICCEPIKEYAVGHCNHRDLCAMCTLKRRELYKENNCCICKAPLPTVIYTYDSEKPFEEFVLHSFIYDSKRNAHFEDEKFYKKVIKLWEYKCPACNVALFSSFDQLKKHAKKEHKLVYCELCVADRKVFFAEQEVYTQGELMKHMVDWDGGVGEPSKDSMRWKGHPMCEFCARHFYGVDQLYKHLQESHFTCHVCEKAGVMYQYYRDYLDLERHFTSEHFPCNNPECLAQKFVFFGSIIDLKAHQLTHTSGKKPSRSDRQIELNFTYLRAGRSGEGVDDPLERSYRHRTRRRDAGYDSDPEAEDGSSSIAGGSSSSAGVSGNKKKGKSKKPLVTSANGARTDDAGPSGTSSDSTNNNNNNNTNTNTNSTTTRAGIRAPQSFTPGYSNRAFMDQPVGNQERDRESTIDHDGNNSKNNTHNHNNNDNDNKEQEARRARENAIKEQQEREREEQERAQEELKKERNKQLVKDLKQAVGDTAYGTLRESGGMYRSGDISAREYYQTLALLLRHHPQLMQHLIALLPDEHKRVALERVHGEYTLWESAYPSLEPARTNTTTTNSRAKVKGKAASKPAPVAVAWDVPKKSASLPSYRCHLCGDSIPGNDKEKHEYFHMHGSPYTSFSDSLPAPSTTYNKPNGVSLAKAPPTHTTTMTNTTTTSTSTSTSTPIPTSADSNTAQPFTASEHSTNYPSLSATPGLDTQSFPSLSSTTSALGSMSMQSHAWGRNKGPSLVNQDFPSLTSSSTAPDYANQSRYDDYDDEPVPTQSKKSSKKSKKKNQVLMHFG